ncbi:interleukin-31 receptor subunit alpha [Podarcis lilfordi]|nr:interleukin-31 receptor subunit alpha [Podarcis lilfordi]
MILNKILYTMLGILTMHCNFCLVDGDAVAHIFPSSPLIESGSTLKVFCRLGKKLFPYKNASHIIWTLNDVVISEENYQIINDSVSGVVIHNFTYGRAHVKCFVDSPVKKQHLAHSEVRSGFPPRPPEIIFCIFYYKSGSTLTCTWTYERNPETVYTLTKQMLEPNEEENCSMKRASTLVGDEIQSCSTQNDSCTIFNQPISAREYRVRVTARNSLGEATSEPVCIISTKILKPDPPQITEIETVPGMKQTLRVHWKKPRYMPRSAENNTRCQIRYKSIKENGMKDYFMEEDSATIDLTNLWDCTNYTVDIRCAHNDSKFWSEWSAEKMGATEEQAPLKVDLWRVLESHQPAGRRTVHLLWKKHEEFPSSGRIDSYRIKYFTKTNPPFEKTVNAKNNSSNFELTGEAYLISVVAHNIAGDSPEAVLKIPSIHEESMNLQRILSLNTSALKEHLFLEWETSELEINEYIIEWYNELETDPYNRSWEYITNVTNWTFPTGTFNPYICYNISVYPLHKGEVKAPSSTRTYFQEGSPIRGPTAVVKYFDKSEAAIMWEEIEKADRRGDIINYTIFYKADGGKELGETVSADVLEYRLKFLQANTKYTAHVMASTMAGGTNGTELDFITHKLSETDIILLFVIVGFFMLCLTTVGLLWALKRRTLKKICWPEIPHPVLPSFPNGFQEKTMLRNSPSENETLSVLRVDPCEKDHDELHSLTLETWLNQTDVTSDFLMANHEILCSEEHEAIVPLAQSTSLGHDFRNPPITAPKVDSRDYGDDEVHDQPELKEKTEFNLYLKNSVHTREFLCQNTEGTKGQPVFVTGQCYVALDAVKLFSKPCSE